MQASYRHNIWHASLFGGIQWSPLNPAMIIRHQRTSFRNENKECNLWGFVIPYRARLFSESCSLHERYTAYLQRDRDMLHGRKCPIKLAASPMLNAGYQHLPLLWQILKGKKTPSQTLWRMERAADRVGQHFVLSFGRQEAGELLIGLVRGLKSCAYGGGRLQGNIMSWLYIELHENCGTSSSKMQVADENVVRGKEKNERGRKRVAACSWTTVVIHLALLLPRQSLPIIVELDKREGKQHLYGRWSCVTSLLGASIYQ